MPASNAARFNPGDRVRHPARPEWGEGRIESVRPAGAGQRLSVSFANHGRVTINTAVVALESIHGSSGLNGAGNGNGNGRINGVDAGAGWLGSIGEQTPTELLAELPEETRDPFGSLSSKISATMDLYRFEHSARGMHDWAVAATGLADPLQRFTRSQMEQAYEAFERARQSHLHQLLLDAWRAGNDEALRSVEFHRTKPAVAAAKKIIASL